MHNKIHIYRNLSLPMKQLPDSLIAYNVWYTHSLHTFLAHLKLLLKSSLLSVIVHYWQDINHIYQFILWHTGVAKQEYVMNGFVDEHILVLHAYRGVSIHQETQAPCNLQRHLTHGEEIINRYTLAIWSRAPGSNVYIQCGWLYRHAKWRSMATATNSTRILCVHSLQLLVLTGEKHHAYISSSDININS